MNAPLRIVEWQILSRHPELWSGVGMAWMKNEKEEAWEVKDYKRIQKLSSKILLFERCREAGAETAFFGRELDGAHRTAVEKEVPPEVAEQVRKALKLRNDAEWEEALTILERLLEELDDNENPLSAEIQHIFGDIFWRSSKGNRAENIEKAIELFENALKVRTRENFPEFWAQSQNNLAVAYLSRNRGDRAENLEKTIELHGNAHEVFSHDDFPEDWALSQNNLANAYAERILVSCHTCSVG